VKKRKRKPHCPGYSGQAQLFGPTDGQALKRLKAFRKARAEAIRRSKLPLYTVLK
jgi:hypothetical protein